MRKERDCLLFVASLRFKVETDLHVSAQRVQRQRRQHGAVLRKTSADLLQSDGQVLEHGVGFSQHVQPLRARVTTMSLFQAAALTGSDRDVLTSSLGASCSTTGVSSANRE